MTKVLTRTAQKSQKSIGLSYEFSTNPSPIVVTPTNADNEVISKADISMVMTNNDEDASFKEIQIHFTIGEDSTGSDFLTNSMENLSVIFNHEDLEVIKSNSNYFLLKSKSESSFTLEEDESLFMAFHCNKVSTKVGNFIVTVMEKAESTTEEEFFFGKFPYGFFLNNFRASPPVVNYEGSTTLYWDGSRDSNTTYYLCSNTPITQKEEEELNTSSLLSSSNEDCFKPTQTKSSQKIQNLTQTSFYTLKAEYKVNEDLAEYYMQTSVYVNDSDITTNNLTVKERLTVESNSITNMAGNITLNGPTTLNSPSTVNGQMTVNNHNLIVKKDVETQGLTILTKEK